MHNPNNPDKISRKRQIYNNLQLKKIMEKNQKVNMAFSNFIYGLCGTSLLYNTARTIEEFKLQIPTKQGESNEDLHFLMLGVTNTFYLFNSLMPLVQHYRGFIEDFRDTTQNRLWAVLVTLQAIMALPLFIHSGSLIPSEFEMGLEVLFALIIIYNCNFIGSQFLDFSLTDNFYSKLNNDPTNNLINLFKSFFTSNGQVNNDNPKKKTRHIIESEDNITATYVENTKGKERNDSPEKVKIKTKGTASHSEISNVDSKEQKNIVNIISFNIHTERERDIFITSLAPGALLYNPDVITFVINISPECREDFNKVLSGPGAMTKIVPLTNAQGKIFELQHKGFDHRLLGRFIKHKDCTGNNPLFDKMLQMRGLSSGEVADVRKKFDNEVVKANKKDWSALVFYNLVGQHENINKAKNIMVNAI